MDLSLRDREFLKIAMKIDNAENFTLSELFVKIKQYQKRLDISKMSAQAILAKLEYQIFNESIRK